MNQVKFEENSPSDVPIYQENQERFQFLPVGRENLQPTCMTSTPLPQLHFCAPQYFGEAMNMVLNTDMTPLPGILDDLTASSSFPQEVAEATSDKSLKLLEADLKRKHRLIRNRDASRECRRRKKEYVKCLEDRLDMLEELNKTLIDELKALKTPAGKKVIIIIRELTWKYRMRNKEYVDKVKRYNTLLEIQNKLRAELRPLMMSDTP